MGDTVNWKSKFSMKPRAEGKDKDRRGTGGLTDQWGGPAERTQPVDMSSTERVGNVLQPTKDIRPHFPEAEQAG